MVPKMGNDLQEKYLWMKPGDISLVSPVEHDIGENEEMYLVYGGHSNKTLFVEYGFTVRLSVEGLVNGECFGELEVQSLVEDLFRKRGKTGEWMKEILMREGYWGDWTMQSTPAPVHPSFRLITALRLYHVVPPTEASEDVVRPWMETILGIREEISKENEALWRKTLVEICEKVEAEAEKGIMRARMETNGEWQKHMQDNIEQLWTEELWIARGVKKSVETGVAF
ncbi:hypothetical protein AX15_003909 [Amanita polypyramis BW_CC]|nr:hypothetical protein AX15_003909 [Amanita polypyramis BW_CC]